MASNYPPGVTGREFAIAGPDYGRESDTPCPVCGKETLEYGFQGDRWIDCEDGHQTDLEAPEQDPDRKRDEWD